MKKYFFTFLILASFCFSQTNWYQLKKEQIYSGAHHQNHLFLFNDKKLPDWNRKVLEAIDIVQATAPDGGGYFAFGKDSLPPESPIGYEVKLGNNSLINPPRKTSYCSGSSYTVLIEALNLIFKDKINTISKDRLEALSYQEPDGGRREDNIKAWGKWNDDGFGSEYSLVQYLDMGIRVKPENALPGDFVNISWNKGGGHSVVFLGWYQDKNNKKYLLYFSSQKSTNGMADQLVPLSSIREVVFVRLTKPDNIYKFNPSAETNYKTKGETIDWK